MRKYNMVYVYYIYFIVRNIYTLEQIKLSSYIYNSILIYIIFTRISQLNTWMIYPRRYADFYRS